LSTIYITEYTTIQVGLAMPVAKTPTCPAICLCVDFRFFSY